MRTRATKVRRRFARRRDLTAYRREAANRWLDAYWRVIMFDPKPAALDELNASFRAMLDVPGASDVFPMVWRERSDELIADYAVRWPGQRPDLFWRFEEVESPPGNDESEAAYLRRLHLLMPGEEKMIEPEMFKPQPHTPVIRKLRPRKPR